MKSNKLVVLSLAALLGLLVGSAEAGSKLGRSTSQRAIKGTSLLGDGPVKPRAAEAGDAPAKGSKAFDFLSNAKPKEVVQDGDLLGLGETPMRTVEQSSDVFPTGIMPARDFVPESTAQDSGDWASEIVQDQAFAGKLSAKEAKAQLDAHMDAHTFPEVNFSEASVLPSSISRMKPRAIPVPESKIQENNAAALARANAPKIKAPARPAVVEAVPVVAAAPARFMPRLPSKNKLGSKEASGVFGAREVRSDAVLKSTETAVAKDPVAEHQALVVERAKQAQELTSLTQKLVDLGSQTLGPVLKSIKERETKTAMNAVDQRIKALDDKMPEAASAAAAAAAAKIINPTLSRTQKFIQLFSRKKHTTKAEEARLLREQKTLDKNVKKLEANISKKQKAIDALMKDIDRSGGSSRTSKKAKLKALQVEVAKLQQDQAQSLAVKDLLVDAVKKAREPMEKEVAVISQALQKLKDTAQEWDQLGEALAKFEKIPVTAENIAQQKELIQKQIDLLERGQRETEEWHNALDAHAQNAKARGDQVVEASEKTREQDQAGTQKQIEALMAKQEALAKAEVTMTVDSIDKRRQEIIDVLKEPAGSSDGARDARTALQAELRQLEEARVPLVEKQMQKVINVPPLRVAEARANEAAAAAAKARMKAPLRPDKKAVSLDLAPDGVIADAAPLTDSIVAVPSALKSSVPAKKLSAREQLAAEIAAGTDKILGATTGIGRAFRGDVARAKTRGVPAKEQLATIWNDRQAEVEGNIAAAEFRNSPAERDKRFAAKAGQPAPRLGEVLVTPGAASRGTAYGDSFAKQKQSTTSDRSGFNAKEFAQQDAAGKAYDAVVSAYTMVPKTSPTLYRNAAGEVIAGAELGRIATAAANEAATVVKVQQDAKALESKTTAPVLPKKQQNAQQTIQDALARLRVDASSINKEQTIAALIQDMRNGNNRNTATTETDFKVRAKRIVNEAVIK